MLRKAFVAAVCLVSSIACTRGNLSSAQDDLGSDRATDPGPRGGSAGAGGPLSGLGPDELSYFAATREVFREVDSVAGSVAGEDGAGLGPTFNAISCAQCHAEPAVGGSSSHPTLGFVRVPNPQIGLATLDRLAGRAQAVPSFITRDGPIREARFVRNRDGTLDGGVHALYTIAGRIDAPACSLAQPDFEGELSRNNVVFRIPTPMFGAGLLENVADDALVANLAATAAKRRALGIGGRFNRSGNDGGITRFGWKAQNRSLAIFAGEAYNVEQGVTSEQFPSERASSPGCNENPTPEDKTHLRSSGGAPTGTASEMSSDVLDFAGFSRLLAPPAPTTASASEKNGSRLFASVGCTLCHSPALTTAQSPFTGQGGVTFHPYTDLALHHMGPGLADHVSQGGAGADEFRSAPLWGVGQRIFFLHDGRAGPRNGGLVAAIEAHRSTNPDCDAAQLVSDDGVSCKSEANGVIANYRALSSGDKQDLLSFLRSL